MVTLKIHSTLPVRERRRGRSLPLIAFVCSSKERECLRKRKAGSQMLSEQRYGNVKARAASGGFQTREQAARCFCCRRSEKLFPVISHLVTSRTNILLLLAPAVVVVVVVFPPQTDGTSALIIPPSPNLKKFCLRATFII